MEFKILSRKEWEQLPFGELKAYRSGLFSLWLKSQQDFEKANPEPHKRGGKSQSEWKKLTPAEREPLALEYQKWLESKREYVKKQVPDFDEVSEKLNSLMRAIPNTEKYAKEIAQLKEAQSAAISKVHKERIGRYIDDLSSQDERIDRGDIVSYKLPQLWYMGAKQYVTGLIKKLGGKRYYKSGKTVAGSVYYELPNTDKVRISDHELPATEQREYNRSVGIGGRWINLVLDEPKPFAELKQDVMESIENRIGKTSDIAHHYKNEEVQILKKAQEIAMDDKMEQGGYINMGFPDLFSQNTTKFAKGGKVDEDEVKSEDALGTTWEQIPMFNKYVSPVKPVKYELAPNDKGLQKILSKIVSTDELRPAMTGINFDGNGVTATDAHKLVFIPNSKLAKKNYGIYKGAQKIDARYPDYMAVIEAREAKYRMTVDILALKTFAEVAMDFTNQTTYQIILKWANGKNIGLNGQFLVEIVDLWMMLGHEEVDFLLDKSSSPILIVPKNGEPLKDITVLLMPVYLNETGGGFLEDNDIAQVDIDWGYKLSSTYDLSTNLVVDVPSGKTYKIDTNYTKSEQALFGGAINAAMFRALRDKFNKKAQINALMNVLVTENNELFAATLETAVYISQVTEKQGVYRFGKRGLLPLGSPYYDQSNNEDTSEIGAELMHFYNKYSENESPVLATINTADLENVLPLMAEARNKDQMAFTGKGIDFLFEGKDKVVMQATNTYLLAVSDLPSKNSNGDIEGLQLLDEVLSSFIGFANGETCAISTTSFKKNLDYGDSPNLCFTFLGLKIVDASSGLKKIAADQILPEKLETTRFLKISAADVFSVVKAAKAKFKGRLSKVDFTDFPDQDGKIQITAFAYDNSSKTFSEAASLISNGYITESKTNNLDRGNLVMLMKGYGHREIQGLSVGFDAIRTLLTVYPKGEVTLYDTMGQIMFAESSESPVLSDELYISETKIKPTKSDKEDEKALVLAMEIELALIEIELETTTMEQGGKITHKYSKADREALQAYLNGLVWDLCEATPDWSNSYILFDESKENGQVISAEGKTVNGCEWFFNASTGEVKLGKMDNDMEMPELFAEGGMVIDEATDLTTQHIEMLAEYSVKISDLVSDETQLETWVVDLLSKAEQSVSDVKHNLEHKNPTKFEHGGIVGDGAHIKKQMLHIATYANEMLEAVSKGVTFEPWMSIRLATAASNIDSVYHYLNYNLGHKMEKGGNIKESEAYKKNIAIWKENGFRESAWEKNGFIEYPRLSPQEWQLVEWSLDGHSPYFKGAMYFQKGTGFFFIQKENGDIYQHNPSHKLFWRKILEYEKGGLIDFPDNLSRDLLDDPPRMRRSTEDFEVGTPVVYHSIQNGEQKEESGEVIIRDGMKTISLYPNKNYAGSDRVVLKFNQINWNNVEKFTEVIKRGDKPFIVSQDFTVYHSPMPYRLEGDVMARGGEIKGGKFTFMQSNPKGRARALGALEKYIRIDGATAIPYYKWMENEATKEKSRHVEEKGGKFRLVSDEGGIYDLDYKAVADYYNYLKEGGYSYSQHLKDVAEQEKVKKELEAKKREAESLKQQEADKKMYLESLELKESEIRETLSNKRETLEAERSEPLLKKLSELKNVRQTNQIKDDIELYEGRLNRLKDRIDWNYSTYPKRYKLVNNQVEPKFNYKVGDEVFVKPSYGDDIKTKIKELQENRFGGTVYLVDKVEGISNPYVGYDSLLPVSEVSETAQIGNSLQQLAQAKEYGKQAFERGAMLVPAQDPNLMDMLKGRTPNETPSGEASSKELMDAWTNGWYEGREKAKAEAIQKEKDNAVSVGDEGMFEGAEIRIIEVTDDTIGFVELDADGNEKPRTKTRRFNSAFYHYFTPFPSEGKPISVDIESAAQSVEAMDDYTKMFVSNLHYAGETFYDKGKWIFRHRPNVADETNETIKAAIDKANATNLHPSELESISLFAKDIEKVFMKAFEKYNKTKSKYDAIEAEKVLSEYLSEVVFLDFKYLTRYLELDAMLPKTFRGGLEALYNPTLNRNRDWAENLHTNIWELLPSEMTATPKIKRVDVKPDPEDKGLINLLSPFVSSDELRPAMMGVYFDDYGITATNAHIMFHLKMHGKERGIYCIKQDCFKKADPSEDGLISERYPAYQQVVPSKMSINRTINVDSILTFLTAVEKSKAYNNDTTRMVAIAAGEKVFGLTISLAVITFTAFKKLGHNDVEVLMESPHRAIVVIPKGNKRDFESQNSTFALLMPQVWRADLIENTAENLDEGTLYFSLDSEAAITKGIAERYPLNPLDRERYELAKKSSKADEAVKHLEEAKKALAEVSEKEAKLIAEKQKEIEAKEETLRKQEEALAEKQRKADEKEAEEQRIKAEKEAKALQDAEDARLASEAQERERELALAMEMELDLLEIELEMEMGEMAQTKEDFEWLKAVKIPTITFVEAQDSGDTISYGTKTNKTNISVKGMSPDEIKEELGLEKRFLSDRKKRVANFNRDEVMAMKGLTKKEKEDVVKENKRDKTQIQVSEKIVIPFYNSKL